MTIFSCLCYLSDKIDTFIVFILMKLNPQKYQPMTPPENVLNAVSGSLLLIKNSLLLRPFVSNYTHVVMLYTHLDKQYVVSMDVIKGCEVLEVTKFYSTMQTNISTLDLYELRKPYSTFDVEKLHTFALKLQGTPYESSGSEFLKSDFKLNTKDNLSTLFCSECVVLLAREIGVPMEGLADNYTPDDFAQMPDFWYIKK